MLHLPDTLPRSLRNGLAWMGCAWMIGLALGFEAPWDRAKNDRDEWVKAHAVATATIEQQGRSIVVLQDRESRNQDDVKAIRVQLNEMTKVIYTLERRSR